MIHVHTLIGEKERVFFQFGIGHVMCVPDILLVVEDLLVAAPGPVLHVGEAPDPAGHLELQFFIVNLK